MSTRKLTVVRRTDGLFSVDGGTMKAEGIDEQMLLALLRALPASACDSCGKSPSTDSVDWHLGLVMCRLCRDLREAHS